jgi:F-type H+-transporting ATPase subunit b
MNSLLVRLASLSVLLTPAVALAQEHAAQAVEHAAEHAGEHVEKAGVLPTTAQALVPMIVSIAVFSVVFAVLAVKVWPAILSGLRDREHKIRTEIESAEKSRKDAENARKEFEASLQQARAEAARMLEQTKAQQGALAAELKAKADAELSAMRERAMKDIETAKRAAVNEIYAEAANLSTTIASKILRREIRAEDQRGLVEESLNQLASAKG